MTHISTPTVLVLAGLDPSGGAGIQADIETLSSLQVHCLPIVSCLTVQDTTNVKHVQAIETSVLQQQIQTLSDDLPILGIKLGLLSNVEVIKLVSKTLSEHPNIPVIFDPILRAGGGANLVGANTTLEKIIIAMREQIIPLATVITPNSVEARLLTGKQNLDDCARDLQALGCENVLITGEHENDPKQITNVLYTQHQPLSFDWPRLPHQYHGSGCTLASAICAYLVKKYPLVEAIQLAQSYTNTALQHAVKIGHGQYIPWRKFTSSD